MQTYWKALYVASRSEKKVNLALQQLGLESYIPLKTEKKQWSDRKMTVISPLINGYVFVNISELQRDLVFRIKGVVQYVRFNGIDAIISENEIRILKLIEKKGYYTETDINKIVSIGDEVIIKHGPFKGLMGIVERGNNEDTFFICIISIGFSLKVKVPVEIIEIK